MDNFDQLPTPEEVLDHERALTHEQLAAAWLRHAERLQQLVESGWREYVGPVLDERFASIELWFRAELQRREALESERLAEEILRAGESARRALTERVNQAARRLDQAVDLAAWCAALLDGASSFASQIALFGIVGGDVNYEGHRSAQPSGLDTLDGLRIPVAAVPAVGDVIETEDTVITMGVPSQLSPEIAEAFGTGQDSRVCLMPVIVGQSEGQRRVAAVLIADGNGSQVDVNVLEILTTIAGLALDTRQAARRAAAVPPPGAVLAIAPALRELAAPHLVEPIPIRPPDSGLPLEPLAEPQAHPAPPARSVDWSELSKEDQELHARAQRFARVRVAEMRLYQSQAVRQGREQRRIYLALRGEMDRGRAQFRHEFLQIPSMIDYFHIEIVRTLCGDDEELLGVEYPGPLV
jgi:hypothetical protein